MSRSVIEQPFYTAASNFALMQFLKQLKPKWVTFIQMIKMDVNQLLIIGREPPLVAMFHVEPRCQC